LPEPNLQIVFGLAEITLQQIVLKYYVNSLSVSSIISFNYAYEDLKIIANKI